MPNVYTSMKQFIFSNYVHFDFYPLFFMHSSFLVFSVEIFDVNYRATEVFLELQTFISRVDLGSETLYKFRIVRYSSIFHESDQSECGTLQYPRHDRKLQVL